MAENDCQGEDAIGNGFCLVAHLRRQRAWSLETFGPHQRPMAVIDHIRKELDEIVANPADIEEWVDVILLALDGAWRSGQAPQAICEAIASKQVKNEARKWPDWRTQPLDKAVEHVRADEDRLASFRRSHLSEGEVSDLRAEILSLSQERDRLKDPAVVHANMLRGTIAKISMDQCAHTHGVQFNELEAAEAKLAEVSQERDRLREALAEIAKQKTRDEVDCPKDVDWALAYGWVVEDARAALNKEPS